MKKKIKILLVEDEVMIAQCMTLDLEDAGYSVLGFVTSGEEAIIAAQEENPDIILMDINLSRTIDGIDAAKEIIDKMDIHIIFLTCYDETTIYERVQEIKPVAYLTKPVEILDLKPIIESIFN